MLKIKRNFLIVAILTYAVMIILLVTYLSTTTELADYSDNQYLSNPNGMFGINFYLRCQGDDYFITAQKSVVKCYIRAVKEGMNHDKVRLNIAAYDSSDLEKKIYWCKSTLENISNESGTDWVLCENENEGNSFIPKEPMSLKFAITLIFSWENISEYPNTYTEPLIFSPEKRVLSIEEANEKSKQYGIFYATLLMLIFTIMILIATMFGILYNAYENKRQFEKRMKERIEDKRERKKDIIEKQETFLKGIEIQIKLIKESVLKQIITIKRDEETDSIPDWHIPVIDSSFYLARLNTEINGRETKKLKEQLIKIQEKAKDINRAFEIVMNSAILNNKGIKNMVLDRISGKSFELHRHMLNMIEETKKELSRFMK